MSKLRPFEPRSLTGAQLRAARALVSRSAADIAEMTSLGLATIRRAEQEDGQVRMTEANARRVVEALEGLGVTFLGDEGDGEGVRLRR